MTPKYHAYYLPQFKCLASGVKRYEIAPEPDFIGLEDDMGRAVVYLERCNVIEAELDVTSNSTRLCRNQIIFGVFALEGNFSDEIDNLPLPL